MKLSSHLKISRHGIYYFRTIIPKAVRLLYDGKTELKYSLRTRDPVTAKRQAYILSAQTAYIFTKAKLTMIRHDPKGFNPLDQSTWPTSKESTNSWEVLLPNGIALRTDPNNPDDHDKGLEALGKIGTMYPALFNTSVAPLEPAVPVSKCIRLSKGIEIFVSARAAGSIPAESTKISERRKFAHFLAWTHDPHDPPLDQITSDTIEAYLTHLQNVGQVQHDGLELTKTTVNTYRAFLNVLFVYLKAKKHYPRDILIPTDGVKVFSRGERLKTQAIESWQPFNPIELELIFKPEHIKKTKSPHEFWLPFLGLYTGARLDELSQIFPHDIRQTNEGLWFLHIHRNDGNNTKNKSSIRRLSIHPDLISLGLIDYIEDVKSIAPSARLFPYLRYCEKNGYASVPSKAFARYLDRKEINITSSKKVFHSFRSTLVQLLEDNNVQEKHIQNLIGHAEKGTIAIHYGKKTDFNQLKDWVMIEIAFPFIETKIQQLKYNRGDFTNAIIQELKNRDGRIKNEKAKAERAARIAKQNKLMEELSA